jgi:hypothetical protein
MRRIGWIAIAASVALVVAALPGDVRALSEDLSAIDRATFTLEVPTARIEGEVELEPDFLAFVAGADGASFTLEFLGNPDPFILYLLEVTNSTASTDSVLLSIDMPILPVLGPATPWLLAASALLLALRRRAS